MANATQFLMAIPPHNKVHKPKASSMNGLVRNPAPVDYSHMRHCEESAPIVRPEIQQCFTLKDFHYMKMKDMHVVRKNLGVLDLPSKGRSAIAGYSGHLARREACNIVGISSAKTNIQAAELHEKLAADSISRYTAPKDSLRRSLSDTSFNKDYADMMMAPHLDLRCFG